MAAASAGWTGCARWAGAASDGFTKSLTNPGTVAKNQAGLATSARHGFFLVSGTVRVCLSDKEDGHAGPSRNGP